MKSSYHSQAGSHSTLKKSYIPEQSLQNLFYHLYYFHVEKTDVDNKDLHSI